MAVDAVATDDESSVDADRVGGEQHSSDATILEIGWRSPVRMAIVAGVILAVVFATLVGWLGFNDFRHQRADHRRSVFVEAAKQGALNLTTINYTEVDKDVQRILDSSTGAFRDDFQKRSRPFVEVVKQAQSTSTGTITAAGLESQDGAQAQVLVAVSVKTATAATPDQLPRHWRMRIAVQQAGADTKVSNVEFVP